MRQTEIPKTEPLQVTNENSLSPNARRFYIPQRDIDLSLPDNEEVDAERAFEIWEAATALINERYSEVDGRADLIRLVNHLLQQKFSCPEIKFDGRFWIATPGHSGANALYCIKK